ncbi:MAG: aromatic amino acid aminotransferase [Lentisphaerae bacterium RIFOXYB12_FULL_65_16]|nr:MAG: aromatic amino acid aminotransferase [Lentisphaerae bacterium RIFOXYA12_64_32]OGV85306.1 MAG: aromatic amino acid aminotransferase [Lentisphaerae bacterium RIFOXYB12_FULL_65_16]
MTDSKSHREWVAKHVGCLPRSGIRDFFDIVSTMSDVISLGIGEPDFVTPWAIREATIYALAKGHTGYTSNLGLLALRRTICTYVEENFGVEYDPDKECIVTVGVSEALDLILRAVLNPGDEAIYHEPCYVSYMPSIALTHAVPVPVVTQEGNGFALSAEAVRAKITPRTRLILLSFPNNPTGASLSYAEKEAMARLAVEHDLLLISDEIYEELTYEERCQSIAAFPGMKERTILLNGFSKAHAMTGYRLGYACGPHKLIEAMMKIHQYSMLCACGFVQEAAIEALRNGRRAMLEMKTEYHQRRNVIVKRLNDMGLPCQMPKGAFYAFPRITGTGMTSTQFATRLLNEKKVACVPGAAFGACGEGYIRCAYATAMDQIEIAMERMAEFVKTL